ncbi:chorismate lyase [Motilimonas sp. 1_MG-2023]|uniref:chorismate--pyruvate lyase family protein n=1 Tax=Motilimonas sp. 1_MG-2023 TaxID=3062672 RepID=UPI0026E319CF|nr:chorismate lyase [Motilimonas sp. 1_MG-2023]MDO6524768.1 chorismate lyase [Motilimonas sp. 1_MG-2023]
MPALSHFQHFQQAFPLGVDASWQVVEHHPELGGSLHSWLTDTGSLTERLVASCQQFSVRLIGQDFLPVSEVERQALADSKYFNPSANIQYLVREVLLCCDQQPWVFARTVIPASTLTGEERQLAELGEQPLGATLFNAASMTRQNLVVAAFSSSTQVSRVAQQGFDDAGVTTLWGRRSLFHLSNKPLLVHEIFLPAAQAYQQND